MADEPIDSEPWLGAVYAIAIFFCGAIGGGTPLLLKDRVESRRVDKVILLGSMFGGGVFIAAGFVHLLGDAAKELNTGEDGYPLAELWCSIGVLIPLCMDSLANLFAARAANRREREAGRAATSDVVSSTNVPTLQHTGFFLIDTKPSALPDGIRICVRSRALLFCS